MNVWSSFLKWCHQQRVESWVRLHWKGIVCFRWGHVLLLFWLPLHFPVTVLSILKDQVEYYQWPIDRGGVNNGLMSAKYGRLTNTYMLGLTSRAADHATPLTSNHVWIHPWYSKNLQFSSCTSLAVAYRDSMLFFSEGTSTIKFSAELCRNPLWPLYGNHFNFWAESVVYVLAVFLRCGWCSVTDAHCSNITIPNSARWTICLQ